MSNRYVGFVSDEHFLDCVKWVCRAYPHNPDEIDMEKLQRNTIDPFKVVFDLMNGNMGVDSWLKNESIRQNDKTINNTIGEFHQKLLGGVNGWDNLGVGDDSKVDLRKSDKTIFIELKNKWNTMNSDATEQCRKKLERAVADNPDAIAYWAYIISQNGTSGESTWYYHGKTDVKVKKVWGKRVYELVTGNVDALENTWKALPLAIKDIIKSGHVLSGADEQKLREFFEVAFGKPP
ncbi:MAG: Eco47II family restriction endonuclease [Candidatus Thermoplasmatota archaeon]|nr:Eco47II family restriction endonuclease [Candidatus Thermoplasmatota archaeon]